LRKFSLKNDAQTPLVICRSSKSKVQTYWHRRSCRCILIHAAMVTYGQQRRHFETIAVYILPDHIHALWRLPEDDPDFSTRWISSRAGFRVASMTDQDRQAGF
jgi:REP element-mobilizing transposase RayT